MEDLKFNQVLGNFFEDYKDNFQIYYILKDGYIYSTYFFDMNKNIKEEFLKKYKEKLNTYSDVMIKNFDVIAAEDEVIEIINNNDIDKHEEICSLLNPIKASKVSDDNFKINKIVGYAIVMINENNKKLIIYRKYINSKSIKENAKLTYINGAIQLLKEEFISIDFKIDAIEYSDNTYVINRYYFQQLFQFREAYVKFVNNSLEALKKENVIDNFEQFSERCLASGNLVRKLVKVVKEDRLKWLKQNIDEAKKVKEEYGLKIDFDSSGKKIDYNSNCNISDVMKLICGCCVKDAVDMRKYIATNVKEVVNK